MSKVSNATRTPVARAVNPTEKQWDKATVLKLIDNVGDQAQTVQNNIQRIAVVAIGYANIHGDVTIAQRACEVFKGKKGIRFNSFVRYLETHGQLEWDKNDIKYRKRDNVLKEPTELLASLSKTRWFDAIKAEQAQSIYDVKAQVEKLIKAAGKAVEDGRDVKNGELVDTLARLIA